MPTDYLDQVERDFQQRWTDDDSNEETQDMNKSLEQIAQEATEKIDVECLQTQGALGRLILTALQQLSQKHEVQVASLTKERDDAREDVKLLAWMEANKERIFCAGWTAEDGWIISENPKDAYLGASILGEGPTLRAAITQAMTGGAE